MLDMQRIGVDRQALLDELRAAGAVIKNNSCNTGLPCPYCGGSDPGSIHQGTDHRFRFKCFSCLTSGDVLDLQSLRTSKPLAEVIHEAGGNGGNGAHHHSASRRPTPDDTATEEAAGDGSVDGLPQRAPVGASSGRPGVPVQNRKAPAGAARQFDTLEDMKKYVEFSDAESLIKHFPDFAGRRTLARTFIYADPETGNADLIAFRMEGKWDEGDDKPARKSCLQGHQDKATGKFIPRRCEGIAPLYNRKALLTADVVCVVEGEPKVAALKRLCGERDFVATCSPGGANAANRADWTPLSGKKMVVIWRDKDKLNPKTGKRPGLEYQNDVLAELEKLPNPPLCIRTVNVDAIATLPEDGSDVVDLIRIMGELPDEWKREVIDGILFKDSMPTGAYAELLSETDDIFAGRRNVIDWPWERLANYTQALTAGFMTVICGSAGSSKSLFLLQAAFEWFKAGVSVAILQLEDNKAFHLRRTAAMMAKCSSLTNLKWQKEHQEEAIKMLHNNAMLERFGQCIHVLPDEKSATVDTLLAWTKTQIQRGVRIIAIDPVTFAELGKDFWNEDTKFVRSVVQGIKSTSSSFIAITHPKKGTRTKFLDDMARTADWGNRTQTALWYEYIPKPRDVRVCTLESPMGNQYSLLRVNRIIHVKKVRNADGMSKALAYDFDRDTLLVNELGEIKE
jgi:hypothetical protein